MSEGGKIQFVAFDAAAAAGMLAPAGILQAPETSFPALATPAGLAAANGKLYVADTNNHAIRVIDLAEGTVETLAVHM